MLTRFVQIVALVLGLLTVYAVTDNSCSKWKHHKNFHLVHSSDDCGQGQTDQKIKPRILNGETPKKGSLPWMAHILVHSDDESELCGGSIINDRYILTAAHCLDDHQKLNITVILGLHNSERTDDGIAEKYDALNYIVHPKYNKSTSKNDIALLRLDRTISFQSPYINYVCLPTSCKLFKKSFLKEKLTIAGWGHITNVSFATTLQKVDVPVTKCKDYELENNIISPEQSQLCAGAEDNIACGGDSGGPLVYRTAGRAVQVGVLSFGPSSCSSSAESQFDFYTKVSSFMGWILDNIGT